MRHKLCLIGLRNTTLGAGAKMKLAFYFVFKITVLLAFLASTTVKADESDSIHQPWDQLLSKHVKSISEGTSTGVNYSGFKADQVMLTGYLDTLSQVSQREFNSWSKAKQLAFLINAYNAWTVAFILTQYPDVASIKELGSFFSSPWRKEFIPLLGKTRSLDNIEHTLIRGEGKYNEPRIHFAVNCASIGCPALRAQAYRAQQLDMQLEQQTKSFLADTTRNYIADDTLYLSPIFKWYRDDFEQGFGGADSLNAFTLLYSNALNLTPTEQRKIKNNTMKIKFLDYNWALNDTP
jgi:hypothetical protein